MKTVYRIPLALPALALAALAIENPQVCDLAVGQTCEVRLAGGGTKPVKLLGLKEHHEPYFESSQKDFRDTVISADVDVEVDGVKARLTGGPFRLPQEVNGVALLVATTKGWLTGVVPEKLSKDVRLEAKDASLPFYDPGRFVFPIRHYRWRVMNYQHTWSALAVNQGTHYYHRGEDFGMIPDLEEVVAMTDGVVRTVPGPQGDGASNEVVTEDDSGLLIRYAHMNTPNIRQDLKPGVRVKQGEKLGLTGATWRAKPTRDSHLHVEFSTGPRRNSFPIIAAAYLKSYPGSVLPIAGGWRHVWAGKPIELDGSLSIAAPGRRITSYEWVFSDGSKARGPKVKRVYETPGVYSEQLRVTDSAGVSDLDFVEVFVLDRNNKQPPPFLFINYYPIRNIRPGTEVRFITRYSRMKEVTMDFGDGTVAPYTEISTHTYKRPGTYVVTAKGADAGAGPAVFHVRVVVE